MNQMNQSAVITNYEFTIEEERKLKYPINRNSILKFVLSLLALLIIFFLFRYYPKALYVTFFGTIIFFAGKVFLLLISILKMDFRFVRDLEQEEEMR